MIKKDTLIVTISDLHSGGGTALFPKRFWKFTHGNHTPTDEQEAMFDHWAYCAGEVAKARKDKRLIIVHDGDAIEGWHHGTPQVVTMLEDEQIAIHKELMKFFKKGAGFKSGDKLYYVKGTEVHTNDGENKIGKGLSAVQNGEFYSFDALKLTINGKRLWWAHKGPTSGKGANKGNGFRNWLRDRFYEAVNEGQEPPHFVMTAHTHDPFWQIYIGRYKGEYFPVRGLICPSWQQRTRYGYGISPLDKNKIGLQFFTIYNDGTIGDPVELLM